MKKLLQYLLTSVFVTVCFNLCVNAVSTDQHYWNNYCVVNSNLILAYDLYAKITNTDGTVDIVKVPKRTSMTSKYPMQIKAINIYSDNNLSSAIPQKNGTKSGVTYSDRPGNKITVIVVRYHPTHVWDLKTTATYNNLSIPGC